VGVWWSPEEIAMSSNVPSQHVKRKFLDKMEYFGILDIQTNKRTSVRGLRRHRGEFKKMINEGLKNNKDFVDIVTDGNQEDVLKNSSRIEIQHIENLNSEMKDLRYLVQNRQKVNKLLKYGEKSNIQKIKDKKIKILKLLINKKSTKILYLCKYWGEIKEIDSDKDYQEFSTRKRYRINNDSIFDMFIKNSGLDKNRDKLEKLKFKGELVKWAVSKMYSIFYTSLYLSLSNPIFWESTNSFKSYPVSEESLDLSAKATFGNLNIQQRRDIIRLSKVVGRLRGVVAISGEKDKDGNVVFSYTIPIIEEPKRAINILYNIARGHAIINGRRTITDEDIEIVRSIAISSAPYDRVKLFNLLLENNGILDYTDIERELGCSRQHAYRIMETLGILRLVDVKEGDSEDEYSTKRKHIVLKDELKIRCNMKTPVCEKKEINEPSDNEDQTTLPTHRYSDVTTQDSIIPNSRCKVAKSDGD